MIGGMLLGVESCVQKVNDCKLTRSDFFLVSFVLQVREGESSLGISKTEKG